MVHINVQVWSIIRRQITEKQKKFPYFVCIHNHSCDLLAWDSHPVNIPDKQNWDQYSVGAPCLHKLTALPPSLHAKWDRVFI